MIHVCFSLHSMTRFLSAAMLSLFENTDSKVTVHLLHDNALTEDNRDKLIQIAEHYGQQLKFYNVDELCADRLAQIEEYFPKAKESQFSIAAFYRLFIPHLLLQQGIEKAIYLDSDIIVNLDIAELWQIELGDKPLAAVCELYQFKDKDAGIEKQKKLLSICREGVVNPEDYFNTGVMLMNLKVLREKEDTILAGTKFISEHPQFPYLDQEILNYCFSTTYLKLPLKFNRLVLFARPENDWTIDKKLYHFAANRICLVMDSRDPYNQLFMKYFLKTPWVDADTRVALSGGLPSRKSYSISIVIPMYNAEEFIAECLESLLIQTFQDFEVIIINNCSTDNSVAIVESYAPKFNGRLRLKKTEKNSGNECLPRNIGLMLTRGEYVYFMDADDMILGTALETFYAAAILYDADVVYTASYYRLDAPNNISLYKDGTSRKMVNINTDLTLGDINTNLNRLLLEPGEGNFHSFWTKFIRRDLLMENKIFFPWVPSSGDFIWVINLYCHAKRLLRISTPLYFYNVYNNNSFSRTVREPQEQCSFWFASFVDFTKALYELEKEQHVLAENPDYCLTALQKNLWWYLNRTEEVRKELSNEEIYKTLHEEFAKKFSYSSAMLLPFLFSSINEREAYNSYVNIFNKFQRYFTAKIFVRINKKMDKDTIQILSVSDDKARLIKPEWWQRNGTCHVIDSYKGDLEIVAKAITEGNAQIRLGGPWVLINPADSSKRLPYWIDYTKLIVNGKTIFDKVTPAWHDKNYIYNLNVKANEEIKIHIEWQPHRSDT